jgi:hypothetical protein
MTAFLTESVAKHPDADGLYIVGAEWNSAELVELRERRLGIAIVSPVIAFACATRRRLRPAHRAP